MRYTSVLHGSGFSAPRRSLFKLAAMAAGLSLLPRAAKSALALGEPKPPRAFLGRLSEAGEITAVDRSAVGADGAFRLHVQAAVATMPLALEAQYGESARHRFWHAWQESEGFGQSPATTVAIHARSGALPLYVRSRGASAPFLMPAVPGKYLIAAAPPGRDAIALEDFHLPVPESLCGAGTLTCRDTNARADFSYAILIVERVPA